MFISFRSESEAISQALEDSTYINASRILSGQNVLIINHSVPFLTDNYRVYLNHLVHLVEANSWDISQDSKTRFYSILIHWNNDLKHVA